MTRNELRKAHHKALIEVLNQPLTTKEDREKHKVLSAKCNELFDRYINLDYNVR